MKLTSRIDLFLFSFFLIIEIFRMLDMGFADAIKKIIQTITKHMDNEKHFQRLLLSATPTTGLLKIKIKKKYFSTKFFCSFK
jgi:superfamily II DNA/RNA helicase